MSEPSNSITSDDLSEFRAQDVLPRLGEIKMATLYFVLAGKMRSIPLPRCVKRWVDEWNWKRHHIPY